MPETDSNAAEKAQPTGPAETLHEWFAHQAVKSPQALALTADGASMTYGQLHDLARGIARRLVASGVRPGDLVPVCVTRPRVVPAILGVLMAGAAYVPLDPRYPDTRLAGLVERAGADVVLTDDDLAVRVKGWHRGTPVLVGVTEGPEQLPPAVAVSAEDLAYVMFTSGSTGAPKGVKVTHRNVTRLMAAASQVYDLGADDVWTMLHSYAFDFSVWEMWGPLLFGGRLVVVEDDDARLPDELLGLIERESVTVLSQTPSALVALASADEQRPARLDHLRLVVLGGERLDPASLSGWFARHGDRSPRIVNMYGITETTVHVTHCPITANDAVEGGGSPIGVPLPDLEVSLRNEDGTPTSTGETGEMWISGPGLARGYLDDDDATARAFRVEVWGPQDERLTYHSGDLARMASDGRLMYVGRRDEQVKVRGYRVELGEVGAALKAHPDIIDACVATDTGESVGTRLLAWATARSGGPDPSELKTFLADRLPGHMIPSELTLLDAMPLTPNGKIDRRALVERARRVLADRARAGTERCASGDDPLMAAVAAIWADELGVARVGPADDFFTLGGHSLMVIKVVTRTRREVGTDVSVRALFQAPRLADFVERVRKSSSQAGAVVE
ncbi:amino acid adenylation domain-containing protein [Streptomyces sp. PTM05]|uniref:Amino acid adenylation domain-containing protein n=1 Tax=Streptantibioticus parmotrematis TaxID=2873249 RepID=A0ABS7QPY4_9ACTN|nr:amino acid adenylation domain-containing protein [Streptantibioticus parmotrematis]MBY8884719.1 amino acid adenylation domain-containing protein [Streptantibioticus parmotrematis]